MRPVPLLSSLLLPLLLALCGCRDPVASSAAPAPFACDASAFSSSKGDWRRFIAHAGGQIDGKIYTNTRDAVDRAYVQGFRLIELDLIHTADGVIVAAHDWEHWRKITGSRIVSPTLAQFKAQPVLEKYAPLTLEDLDAWFAQHEDAYLVTDKIRTFKPLLKGFSHYDRLIVEVFSVADYHRAVREGIRYPLLSIGSATEESGAGAVRDLIATEPIKFAALSTKKIEKFSGLLGSLRRRGACVFAFSSDEAAFLEREFDRSIFGVYTDYWSVREGACTGMLCRTY